MDADDVAHPRGSARSATRSRADPALAAVGSRVRLFPRRERPGAGWRRYAAWLNGLVTPASSSRAISSSRRRSSTPPSTSGARRSTRAGGWRDGPFPEDYDPLAPARARPAAGSRTCRGRCSPGASRPARATRTDPRYALARHVALKCAHLAAGPLAGRREVAVWGAGETGKAFADALAARGSGSRCSSRWTGRRSGGRCGARRSSAYEEVGRARGLPLLVAVGAPGARDLIRAELARAGFGEPDDFRCVA